MIEELTRVVNKFPMDNRSSGCRAAMSLPVLIVLALVAVVDAAAFIEERGESHIFNLAR